ncbi:hypothetical protein [Alloactinosynnema sp. L-07]|uniref:DUF4192 domain-containing protein n=1 Tax=Alloactinosynnema sp. L-07 TaxID=1653480 RepID=UPI00065F038A|nr:DUF4192 domain-containing protein [Alloactinosynnema sp. L-07]CRK55788.1 hypothetical protein [Alloactinosynnema sp. L-07]
MNLELDNGGDLVAAVPHLLGFHPSESAVVVTVEPDGDTFAVGPVLRADLPASAEVVGLSAHLADTCSRHRVGRALVVIVGGPGRLSHRDFVDQLIADLNAVGVVVDHPLWVRTGAAGEMWWCYAEPECSGVVPDPDITPFAVMRAVEGAITYPTREALVASLAPDPPDILDQRARALDTLVGAEVRAAIHGECDPNALARDMALIHAAVAEFASATRAEPDLDEDRLVALTLALTQEDVRGECFKIVLSADADAATRLWTRLTRSAPAPERAEPACLLAIGAHLRGDGVLANAALDVALAADPGHEVAGMLKIAVQHAISPKELRHILTRAGRTPSPREGPPIPATAPA